MVQGSQQTVAHLPVHGSLNIKYLGLDLLSLFFLLLSGMSYWIESNLDIVSSMEFCSQKVTDEKQGFGMSESNTNDKAVTWENNSCKSDFIVSDGEA